MARARAGLMRLGVRPGDRVAAYLPNIPETIVAFLATASIGAVWSSCAARVRRAGGDRPLHADRTQRAPGRGRLPLRRAGDRPARRGRPDPRRPADPARRRRPRLPRPRRPAAARRDRLGRPARRAGSTRVRARRARPPALRPLLERHDGAAQADRARPRRHPPRAVEGARAALRPRPRRPSVLVHHDRLDDVELPGRRAPPRLGDRAVRRRPRPPRPADPVAVGAGDGDHLLRRQRTVPPRLPQGGHRARPRARPLRPAIGRFDRCAPAGGGVPVGLRGGEARRAALLDQRRDRHLLGVRRRMPPRTGVGRRDLVQLPRRQRSPPSTRTDDR